MALLRAYLNFSHLNDSFRKRKNVSNSTYFFIFAMFFFFFSIKSQPAPAADVTDAKNDGDNSPAEDGGDVRLDIFDDFDVHI